MKRNILLCAILVLVTSFSFGQSKQKYPFMDTSLSLEERVSDLLSRLTLEEKVSLMQNDNDGVPRLGIPSYDWWNECLHGVARTSEKTTSFPQAIGMAATFDQEAMHEVGNAISTEGRAIFNEDMQNHKTGTRYRGLTYWSPNINIFRDPRWGRGQETYGEDPYLTSHMAVQFIKGIQGDDPYYYKAVACAKHLVAHSGPEPLRRTFDARPSTYDLWDTYLPAFRATIKEGKVGGVMCTYNRFDGQPCCGNANLLTNIIRRQFGFEGYMTSDCQAVRNFYMYHKTHADSMSASSDAILSGTDIECGKSFASLVKAVNRGMIAEKDLNVGLGRSLNILFRLGMFDPQEMVPYSKIGKDVLECDAHKQLASKMGHESIVLLKNDKNTLPLNSKKIKRIALIGPNADQAWVQLGNYEGHPSEVVTPKMSLERKFKGQIEIDYQVGCSWVNETDTLPSFQQVASRAKKADVIIFVGGITSRLEGEHMAVRTEGFLDGDRTKIELPEIQEKLLAELKKTGRPIIYVNMSGSAVSLPWAENNANAIIQAWYPGQDGGNAIVDVIFGNYNPSGRLPITIYRSTKDLPDFTDYSMQNRTYRYYRGDVQYPFGYGLSYTTFDYSIEASKECGTGENVTISGKVTNTGSKDGDDVIQLYIKHKEGTQYIVPIHALKGFKRITLQKGESKDFEFTLTPEDLALVDEKGNMVEKEEDVTIFIGGGQPGISNGASMTLSIKGSNYNMN